MRLIRDLLMPSLLDRLRSALAPSYEVERELAAGGMGAVFVARDPALDRRVAIKILRPELATADAVDRFLREGRTLASLRHPNIVPVHQAGEADGLFYYVMDLLEGETLEQRLARQPLTTTEARQLGADLLAGLSHAHAHGVVHRDVKPANIFFHGDRAVLVDFGVARIDLAAETRTRPDVAPGTPAYMAPEQLRGEATERSDIHLAGMVMFEALTGRRWVDVDPADPAVWRRMPRAMARVIGRALERTPQRRWATAIEFREQLLRTSSESTRTRVSIAAAALLAAALLAGGVWYSGARTTRVAAEGLGPSDLALLPLQALGDLDPIVGRDVALLTALTLDGLPGFSIVPPRVVFRTAQRNPPPSDAAAARELHTRFIARGSVARVEGGFEARVLVLQPGAGDARPLITVRTIGDDHAALADALARELVRSLHPTVGEELRVSSTLSRDVRALREFLAAEHAVQRNAWHSAERHYVAAIALDSTFALASWRLATVRRWLPRWTHGTTVDLATIHRDHLNQFSERDRMLLEVELMPLGAERLAGFERVARRFPRDPYTLLLYGDELFHRGPLFGTPLERAVTVLAEAAALDTLLAPAHEHLAWAYMLLGNAAEARRAVEAFTRTAAPPERGAVYAPAVFDYILTARFDPERSRVLASRLAGSDPATAATWLTYAVRYGLAFGIPEAQLAMASTLASSRVSPASRAIGLEAQAHALLALGRAAEAFAKADTVAALRGTAEAYAESASWRVLPAALGWPIGSPIEVRRGREMLERLAAAGDASSAAAWALTLDALHAGDTARAARWMTRAQANPPTPSPDAFRSTLIAARAAAQGDLRRALAASAPIPEFLPTTAPGSFVRAARYVSRAGWLEATGDLDGADREWIWADNTDQLAMAREGAAAGEVDRIFGTYASYRRGMLAIRRGDAELACRLLRSVTRHWAHADPPFAPLLRDAQSGVARSCGT